MSIPTVEINLVVKHASLRGNERDSARACEHVLSICYLVASHRQSSARGFAHGNTDDGLAGCFVFRVSIICEK